ncbi:peptidoglycan-binding domain-containing protein [Mycoplana rhizolycopersici]|nr:peptidoglycan-binding protein [Rhizobium rhizolycopersici]
MTTARLAKLGLAGLVGFALAGVPAVQADETKPPVSASKRWESEFSMWQKVSSSSDPAGYEDYLKQFPNGTFASMARLRLAELNAAGASKPSSGAASAGTAVGEKERNEEARKAAEAERLKAEQEAKVAAERAQAEQDRLAAEAERKRIAEEERLREEEQARAQAEAKRAAEARAEAERQAAEAERKRAQEAERLRAEQEAKAEQARLKAEQEAKAAAEAQAKAEAEQAAAEAERERAQAAAEADRLKAAEEAKAAAEARARADEAAADKAKAEAEKAQAEAERLRAAEAVADEGEKGADSARPAEESRPAGATADALDTEALPTGPGPGTEPDAGSQAATTDDAGAGNGAGNAETERQARREDNAWSRAVLNGRAQAFEGYLRVYPDGRFADQARERLSAIEKQGGTAQQDAGQPSEDNAGLGGSGAGSAGAGGADQGSVVSARPIAPGSREVLADPRQPTIYRTPGVAREAYLEPATRAQSQQWLSMLGYNTGGVDGVFGSRTRGAIAAWQRSAGYAADGYLTRKQFRQLGEAARYAQRRDRQYVARQRAQRDRYYNDGYGVYEGPVGGGYLEGPVGGYYEGPVDGYYGGPSGDLTISGPGY